MGLTFWILIFVVSLMFLVRGSQWFLTGAERIGLKLGFSPFVIGAIIVALGTSLPELVSSIVSVIAGVPEVVVANATGSNIANILLVLGVVVVIARKLEVTKDLIDIELPLLSVSTILFLGVVFDGVVSPFEAWFLITAYVIYFLYSLRAGEKEASPVVVEKSKEIEKIAREEKREKNITDIVLKIWAQKEYVLFLGGLIAIYFGARYLIESLVVLSRILDIAPGVISITAMAIGTSLPELFVSVHAALAGKSEVAIGNILGSNAFNALMVVGIPGVFGTLPINEKTLTIGIPLMAFATLLFIISGISRRIHHWEGMMFLVLYALFIFKLFGIM